MRLRNIPIAKEVIAGSACVIKEPKEKKGMWKEIFGNDHPLRIEVGMGKGQFIIAMAKEHPEINISVSNCMTACFFVPSRNMNPWRTNQKTCVSFA